MRAGAKIVGFVNNLPRVQVQGPRVQVQGRVVRIPRIPGPDFSGPAPRPVRYYGIEAKPRMNRLSGAASEIPPGDVGCALCQFLVQRTQQDFAAFNAAAGGKKGGKDKEGGEGEEKAAEGEKEGGDESGFLQIQELPALNDKNFVEAVLLEVEGQVAEEEEEEEQTEEEEESEETEEEEESEEDVSLLSTASAATTGLSSEEQQELTEVLEETHDEAVADAVEKSVNGEQVSMFGAQVTESDLAAHPDFDESLLQITDEEKEELADALQKSDAIVAQLTNAGGADLTDAEKAELAAMLEEEDETSESQDASYLTPKMVESVDSDNAGVSFIETATKPRHYARMLHKAEEQTPVPDIVTTSFLSLGGITKDSWREAAGQRVNLPSTPRRFRLGDVLSHRPVWNRFDPTVAPHPNAERQKARIMFQHMLQYTYDRLEGYCSTRLPEQFFPFCGPMLRNYRLIAEGIRYGDRPDQICMRGNFCPKGSYIRINSPHSVFAKLQ